MTRKEILAQIKSLDEKDIAPYLYSAMTNGSTNAEEWLSELEERDIKTERDLIDALVEMGMM